MKIRELGAVDAAQFWELRLRGFREDPTSFGYSPDEMEAEGIGNATNILNRVARSSSDFVLGAFEADALVGILGLERERRRKRAHRAKVWGMYVAAEARGKGVGRALLVDLIDRSRRTPGLNRLLLTVIADNARAVSLYKSLGFEVYGHERGAMRHDERDYDEYSMSLEL